MPRPSASPATSSADTDFMLSVTDRVSGKFVVDHTALSEAFLARAQELEPTNPRWPADLEQLRKLRSTANQPR